MEPEDMKKNSYYFKWGMTAFFVLAAVVVFTCLIFNLNAVTAWIVQLLQVLAPVIIGLVLAYILTPICNFFEHSVLVPVYKKLHLEPERPGSRKRIRALAILITMFLSFYILYIFFYIVLKEVIASLQSIILQFPIYLQNFEEWGEKLLKNNSTFEEYFNTVTTMYYDEINQWINKNVLSKSTDLLSTVSSGVFGVAKGIWNLVIGFIVSIYVLGAKENFAGQAKKMVYSLFKRDKANQVLMDFRYANRIFGAFISGKLIDSLIIGIICFILMTIFHINYPVLISVVIGVTNIIPFFGPFIGGIPCALLILVISPLNGLKFIIMILLLQQFDGNVLGPKILGDSTGLSSFWVLFSITLFGAYFGVIGMLIGCPTFALIYAAIRRRVESNLKKKSLPQSTGDYVYLSSVDEEGNFRLLSEEDRKNSRKKSGAGKKSLFNKMNKNKHDTGVSPDNKETKE